MSDPFLDAESGVESSQPRELYEINQTGLVVYRTASGSRDITYDGKKFVAAPIARTDVVVDTTSTDGQLTLALPLSHGLCQRWNNQMSPPRLVTVTIYRQQLGVDTEVFFQGVVMSMAMEKHIAKFLLMSDAARLNQRTVGALTSKKCLNALFDKACGLDANSYKVATLVTGVNGRNVTVASTLPVDGDPASTTVFALGRFVHTPTGESQIIVAQHGATLTLQRPIPGLQVGDFIAFYAGCAKDILTCHNKFGNEARFFGQPHLPTHELFIPGYQLGVLTNL